MPHLKSSKLVGLRALVASLLIVGGVAAQEPGTAEAETGEPPGAEEPVSEEAPAEDVPSATSSPEPLEPPAPPAAPPSPPVNVVPTESPTADEALAIAAPADAPEAPAPVAGYDKGFFIRSADEPYELKLNVMVQPRFTWEGVEDGPDEAQLALKRARLKLTGTAFDEDLTYFFMVDFGSGSTTLTDLFLDYGFVPGWLHVRLGQFRRPFSRQFISAITKMELVDRSIADKAFGADRDIGVVFHNRYEKSPQFEYAVGAFNGTGYGSRFSGSVLVDPATGEGEVTSGKFSNVPDRLHPLFVARVGYNSEGLVGYSEADLEGGAPRLGVGLAGLIDTDGDGGDDSVVRGTVDAMLKAYGLSVSAAGFVSSMQTGDAFGDRAPEAVGFALQGGFVIADRFQPVARWAAVLRDGPDNNREELLGGLSIYFKKHSLKWQTDAGVIAEETTGATERTPVVRSQLQAIF